MTGKTDSARFSADLIVDKCNIALRNIASARARDFERKIENRVTRESKKWWRRKFNKPFTSADAIVALSKSEGVHASEKWWSEVKWHQCEEKIQTLRRLADRASVEAIGREVIVSADTFETLDTWENRNV